MTILLRRLGEGGSLELGCHALFVSIGDDLFPECIRFGKCQLDLLVSCRNIRSQVRPLDVELSLRLRQLGCAIHRLLFELRAARIEVGGYSAGVILRLALR